MTESATRAQLSTANLNAIESRSLLLPLLLSSLLPSLTTSHAIVIMACYSCIVVAGLILSSGIVVFGSKQDSLPRSAKHHTNTGISSTSSSSSSSCGVYLAESTIPHAGLGMYAGKDFEEKEEITAGDIIIPLIEIDWNNGHEGKQAMVCCTPFRHCILLTLVTVYYRV
jgi:hypothetical protein